MNTNVTKNKFVNEWIAEMVDLVNPKDIVLIDGTEAQAEAYIKNRLSIA